MNITPNELKSIAATIQFAAPSATEITVYLKHKDIFMNGHTSIEIAAEYEDGSKETLACPMITTTKQEGN